MRRQVSFFLIALLLLPIVSNTMAYAQAPAQPIIREIVIRGFEHLSADDQAKTRAVIKSQVGQPYNRETAEEDRDNIINLGWFFRVTFTDEPVEGGVRLVFTVTENPVVTAVVFRSNTQLTNEQLLKVVQTKSGQVLNRDQVTKDALAIKEAYAKEGFTLVEITDINITPAGQLEFFIFEPKIGEVRIEGNRKTRGYVIRRELEIRPGDVYNEKDIRRSLLNLEKLGIFQEVTAVPEPGTEPGTLIVAIRVKERRTGLAAVGVGSSNIQGLIGFVDVADTNLFGTGQSVSARVQFGANSSYQLSYTNPWISTKRTSLNVNLYDRTILRQLVQENDTLYNERRSGGDVTIGRPIAKSTSAFVTLRANRISATPEDNNPVPEQLQDPSDVRSIALSAVRDNRDSVLNPTMGSYATLSSEFAGFGGASFTKLYGEGRRYWPIRRGQAAAPATTGTTTRRARPPMVVATRLMAGTITGAPPFLDQFLIGGANSLRGYKEDEFPGENMVVLNSELRVPINESLQVVGFVDAGDAWGGRFIRSSDGTLLGDPDFDLHLGYGLGVRVNTPIGPLRLDYGISAEGGNELHFGIGSTF